MDEDLCVEEEVSCMHLKKDKDKSAHDQLAFIMHRFNLDWSTVETMPAFDEHRKVLMSGPKKVNEDE